MNITTSAASRRPPLESNLPIAFARAWRTDKRTRTDGQNGRICRRNPINSSTLSSSSLGRGARGSHL